MRERECERMIKRSDGKGGKGAGAGARATETSNFILEERERDIEEG